MVNRLILFYFLWMTVMSLASAQNVIFTLEGFEPCSDVGTNQVAVQMRLTRRGGPTISGTITRNAPEGTSVGVRVLSYKFIPGTYRIAGNSQAVFDDDCALFRDQLLGTELFQEFLSNCTSGDCLTRNANDPPCPVTNGEYSIYALPRVNVTNALSENLPYWQDGRWLEEFHFLNNADGSLIGCFGIMWDARRDD